MPTYDVVLSSLDQIMPMSNTAMWLVFQAKDVDAARLAMQKAIDRTVSQLPFLSGKIYEKPEQQWRAFLKWSDENPTIPFEEITGTGLPTYQELADRGFVLENFPIKAREIDLTPNPGATKTMSALEAAYVKLEGGLLVLLAPHHCLVDGGGRHVLYQILAANCRDPDTNSTKIDPCEPVHRAAKFSEIIQRGLELHVKKDQAEEIRAKAENTAGPEPRKTPGTPEQLDPIATRTILTFQFSSRRLEALRQGLRKHTKKDFSLNTLLSVLLLVNWTDSLKKRLQARIPGLNTKEVSSALYMAVGGRRLYEQDGLLEKGTWLGNLVSQVKPPMELKFDSAINGYFDLELSAVGSGSIPCPSSVPALIDEFTGTLGATAASNLASDFAETEIKAGPTCSDLRQLRFAQMSSTFNGMTLLVTNWAAFDFLLDYGPVLGRPKAASLMNIRGAPSGMCIMYPRHRSGDDEALRDRFNVCFACQEEDVEVLNNSKILQAMFAKA